MRVRVKSNLPAAVAWASLSVLLALAGAQTARASEAERIDCHSGEIAISGEQRKVELEHCKVIRVKGSHNMIAAHLPKAARVFVTGNGNLLALQRLERHSAVPIKDTGRDNRIVMQPLDRMPQLIGIVTILGVLTYAAETYLKHAGGRVRQGG